MTHLTERDRIALEAMEHLLWMTYFSCARSDAELSDLQERFVEHSEGGADLITHIKRRFLAVYAERFQEFYNEEIKPGHVLLSDPTWTRQGLIPVCLFQDWITL